MAIKKGTDEISNEGSRYANFKADNKVANIAERFDDTTHNDNPYDDAIQYLAKKVEDIIDETNTQIVASGSYVGDIKILKTASGSFATMSGSFSTRVTANDAKTGITSGQTSAITANTAKIGTETDLSVTTGMTLKATVAESKGVYTLTFTVTHGRVTKTANITMS